MHNAEVGGLKAGNKYQLRLRAYNDRGPSEWSQVLEAPNPNPSASPDPYPSPKTNPHPTPNPNPDPDPNPSPNPAPNQVLEVTVPHASKFRPAEHALPRSWLAADYSDLIAQAEAAADDPASAEEPAANFYPNPNPIPSPSPSPSPNPNPSLSLSLSLSLTLTRIRRRPSTPLSPPRCGRTWFSCARSRVGTAHAPHVHVHSIAAARALHAPPRNASLSRGVARRASHGR